MNKYIENFFKKLDKPSIYWFVFVLAYLLTTFVIWKKYDFNPTCMVNFGQEFAKQNPQDMPKGAVVITGYEGDLGNGYDGQIFYFYSRTISNLTTSWPKGFDESYRAPRIGYPFLVAIFGLFGKYAAIFGMYFLNIALFGFSFWVLRKMLGEYQYLSWFYLLSPFSLGSYTVLVSDSVMVSLVIISYYFYTKDKFWAFIPIASIAVLTKEPALFFYFPLGLKNLLNKDFRKSLVVVFILVIPAFWYLYLKLTFPHWRPTRLTDFILPLEGITTYLQTLYNSLDGSNWKDLARAGSRIPLLLLFVVGIITTLTGKIQVGYVYRVGLLFTFFMVGVASYYHFWSVYENVSRMFTISIPLLILLKKEDTTVKTSVYFILCLLIFALFLVKVVLIQKVQGFTIWG
ncbi:MAG: EpsG family protein [Leptospiraceae bacterium]|nr:EpsG family protein [Leptospiraceae bacterium]MCP5494928.1 EpsG family protein [Leptospiraceae bacterium]